MKLQSVQESNQLRLSKAIVLIFLFYSAYWIVVDISLAAYEVLAVDLLYSILLLGSLTCIRKSELVWAFCFVVGANSIYFGFFTAINSIHSPMPVYWLWSVTLISRFLSGTFVGPRKVGLGVYVSILLGAALVSFSREIPPDFPEEFIKFELISFAYMLGASVGLYEYKSRMQKEVSDIALSLELEAQQAEHQREINLAQKESLEELRRANETLVQQTIKRNQLFGMVAHELRTPVAAISMMASEHDAQEWQSDKETIGQTVADLLNTIDDMRLLINPELARPVRLEAFKVSDMNASVRASMASLAAASGVDYQVSNEVPESEDEYVSDAYRLRVAITNIVRNACLHAKSVHVWVLSRQYTDQNQEYLEWSVSDDGIGIPEGQIERLFQAGERGNADAEGVGLGLHIAKSWIEEIGGVIEYHRRSVAGSEFKIRAPLVRASGNQPSEPHEEIIDRGRLERLLEQLNVLMVEDEAVLRMLGQKLVSKLVASIETAENGVDGLATFDPQKHNLILTDYFMPEMSGAEMSRKLREQGYEGVIIGITAATIGEQSEEMIAAGVDLVLPKPLNAAGFQTAIAQLLREGRFDTPSYPGVGAA